MALQSTMGPTSDVYVTKTAFYWSIGIIILLLAAISFSMARDLSRLSVTERGVAVERTQQPVDTTSELPQIPPDPAVNTTIENRRVETSVNPDMPANNQRPVNTNTGAGNTQ